jgi:flavin reductase (DIM6/NTAB) family NADH-FMN oxidoreductase RutF
MSIDSRAFRNALGRFTTGICVITASPRGLVPLGMTVNSFCSVSLEPPLVLWSLQNNSDCYPAFQAADHFTINVLTQEQQALSQQYAKKGQHQLLPEHYRIGRSGAPVLRDCLASFECSLWRRYEGGDHELLVGQVIDFESRPTGKPLLFYSGSYRELR